MANESKSQLSLNSSEKSAEKSNDETFREYHSMENIEKSGWIKTIEQHPCAEQKWVMLEKIHGSNFQFWTDGDEVKVGKRTAYLIPYEVKFMDKASGKEIVKLCDPRAGFFRADHIANLYSNNVKALHSELFGDCSKIEKSEKPYIIVYGEIFGGFYNDETKKPWQRVQLEVQYHPENKFMAFDIVTYDNFKLRYTNYDRCIELFEKHKIPYIPILFTGTFKEVYEKSQSTNADPTTIPKMFGLEEIIPNIREGHVLKPVEPAYAGRDIIYIKDKNDKFKEVHARKKNPISMSRYAPGEVVGYDFKEFLEEAPNYITDQRCATVISKYGFVPLDETVEKKVLNELVVLYLDDIIKDLQKDLGHVLIGGDYKDLRKHITPQSFETVRKYCKWAPPSKKP